MGVPSDLVIYANPCKQRSMLQYARNNDVRMMTADNLVSCSQGPLQINGISLKFLRPPCRLPSRVSRFEFAVSLANFCGDSSSRNAAECDTLIRDLWIQAELEKIAAIFPEARVVIRIAVDDSKSVCRFNSKFGAAEHEWPALLRRASELGLNIYGVSFHVGSGCQDSGPFG